MLVIHPDECIDCGVCEPESPAETVLSESYPSSDEWVALNARYAAIWPNISIAKAPAVDAASFDGVPDKLKSHFSEKPRDGDV